LGIDGADAEPFWLVVRGNLERLADAAQWWSIIRDGPTVRPAFAAEDTEFLTTAFDNLPAEPWDRTTWKAWTDRLKELTGRKGRGLFMPLRLALTGREQGPELADLLPLLGREGTLARRP